MRKEISRNVARYQFDSLSELGQYIKEAPRTWPTLQSSTDRKRPPRDGWDLNAGYDGAVRRAREGWLEGARDIDAAMVEFPPKDAAPDTRTDFYGHMPHVARFCAGAPDNMIRHSPVATSGGGRVLTLYVPINANAGTDARHMRNFGIGVAQAISTLETVKRIRVELYGVFGLDGLTRGWACNCAWRIKYADQPLDLAALAFSIGHTAMFRRLGFAFMERCAAPESYGYGAAKNVKLTDLIDPPAGAYILNGMANAGSIARTPAEALTYVEKQINTLLDEPDAD